MMRGMDKRQKVINILLDMAVAVDTDNNGATPPGPWLSQFAGELLEAGAIAAQRGEPDEDGESPLIVNPSVLVAATQILTETLVRHLARAENRDRLEVIASTREFLDQHVFD